MADVALTSTEGFDQHLTLDAIPRITKREARRLRRRLDREVLGLDEPAARHDDGALDGVFQLADVARPAMPRDGFDGGEAEPELPSLLLAAATEEGVGQEYDVLASFPSWRHRDHDD